MLILIHIRPISSAEALEALKISLKRPEHTLATSIWCQVSNVTPINLVSVIWFVPMTRLISTTASYGKINSLHFHFFFRSIVFMPVDNVIPTWEQLVVEVDERLRALITWFENTYIGGFLIDFCYILFLGKMKHDGRADPRFAIASWSVFTRTAEGKLFSIREFNFLIQVNIVRITASKELTTPYESTSRRIIRISGALLRSSSRSRSRWTILLVSWPKKDIKRNDEIVILSTTRYLCAIVTTASRRWSSSTKLLRHWSIKTRRSKHCFN